MPLEACRICGTYIVVDIDADYDNIICNDCIDEYTPDNFNDDGYL